MVYVARSDCYVRIRRHMHVRMREARRAMNNLSGPSGYIAPSLFRHATRCGESNLIRFGVASVLHSRS